MIENEKEEIGMDEILNVNDENKITVETVPAKKIRKKKKRLIIILVLVALLVAGGTTAIIYEEHIKPIQYQESMEAEVRSACYRYIDLYMWRGMQIDGNYVRYGSFDLRSSYYFDSMYINGNKSCYCVGQMIMTSEDNKHAWRSTVCFVCEYSEYEGWKVKNVLHLNGSWVQFR